MLGSDVLEAVVQRLGGFRLARFLRLAEGLGLASWLAALDPELGRFESCRRSSGDMRRFPVAVRRHHTKALTYGLRRPARWLRITAVEGRLDAHVVAEEVRRRLGGRRRRTDDRLLG